MEGGKIPLNDWTDFIIAFGSAVATLFGISRWLGGMIEARIMRRLEDPEHGAITKINARLDRLSENGVRLETWLELNKALLAKHGGAFLGSPFELDGAWLRERIQTSRYVPDPVMLAEFRRIAEDPMTPADDHLLWNVIELRFGARELAQEVMRFGAPGDTAPAIWILCIRRAQQIGVDVLLEEIGLGAYR